MNQIFREKKGFTLVEIAIVMVIVGLILAAATTVWRNTLESTKLSSTKSNLDNIKSAVINFAIANGRLPCPDSTVPPNNTGQSNPVGAGICTGCAAPPCFVPFQTLQIQLPGGRDSFGNVFRYDVSFDTAGGALGGLTNTSSDTFCGVLYEYMVRATDAAVPRAPCVTNTNDGADNGQIGAAGQGYSVAALIISETDTNSNIFNAPIGLNLKNIAGTLREYEMAGRTNDTTYGNLLGELTFGELFSKICTSQKTKIRIQNYTGAIKYAQFAGSSACTQVNPTTGYMDIYQGSTITFYDTLANCQAASPTCGNSVTFNMTGGNDAGTIDWSGAGIYGRDGRVQITGACASSDNTNTNP
ncbi:MAG: type II secretion system protein [Deltaproteobacteria bacterium]|nr:type II secretion system protein [Deltaproteobacteria bacterium]